MRTMADFLDHFSRQHRWTVALVEAIPDEHFDWAPAEGAFSCGDLVRHSMQAEIFWSRLLTSAAGGETFDPFGLDGSAQERLEEFRQPNLEASRQASVGGSVSECLTRWAEIRQRTRRGFGELPDSALVEVTVKHPLTRVEAPLWRMLLLMVEHEAHHRGQLSAYLKMLGVEQPAAAIAT